jgi:hypothetical protein
LAVFRQRRHNNPPSGPRRFSPGGESSLKGGSRK